jgi:hypothetical protein
MDTMPLSDAIRALRNEILAARDEAAGQEVRFEVGPIEMEFHVIARKEIGGGAKVGFHIFAAEATLGASGKGADERVQKVKIVLNAISVDASGRQSKIAIARKDDDGRRPPSKRTLERG